MVMQHAHVLDANFSLMAKVALDAHDLGPSGISTS